jgi:membrane protease YdiL (CAAX protease family)
VTALAVAAPALWALAAWLGGPWLGVGGAALALGAVVLVAERPSPRAITAARIAAGAGAGLAMCAVTYLVHPAVARALPWLGGETADLYATFRSAGEWAILLAPIVVGEELVWRGLVQGALAARLGAAPAVPLAAALFALAHAPLGSPLLALVAFVCAVAFGALRAWTGSLVPAVAAHLVWNGSVLVLWPLV